LYQARETGICPVREELYSQTFDELIRQVAINCSERGLLLLRVRDEIRMTISAYQTLYESSVAFGMRKALQAEQGKSDMEAKIKQLEAEKKELERQVQDQKAKCEAIEKREAERRTLEEKKHNEAFSPAVEAAAGVSPRALCPCCQEVVTHLFDALGIQVCSSSSFRFASCACICLSESLK